MTSSLISSGSFTADAFYEREARYPLERGLIHRALLGLVWLTFAVSSIVFTEPAPVDLLFMGLIVVLPATGLVAFNPGLSAYIALWSLAAAGGLISTMRSQDLVASTTFTAITVYLYVASFILAAFVAKAPRRHCELILSGWLVAALIAAMLAFIGYFDVLPGAYTLFTKFSRAAGTFKDPNVFGPFLVAPVIYALHLALHAPALTALRPVAIALILSLANLLSYSRGAWLNLALAVALYGILAFATSRSRVFRLRIVTSCCVGFGCLALLGLLLTQNEKVANLLADRASVTQSYDVGPDGRFGGQEKAVALLLERPMGIGATQFTALHHHEEVHNVFLSMFLNAGWLGGLTYALMVVLTIVIGLRHALKPSPTTPLFLITYAAFTATALEGIIIDSDHWRSFYVLMAMVWGMATAASNADRKTAGDR